MLPSTASSQRKKYSLTAIFWLIAILLGSLQAWVYRYNLSSDDLISYLDIGDAYLRGEWQAAINGYWSPLYSWILALTIFALNPSTYWEFPTVKLANFLIYLFSLVCFNYFLRQLIFYYQVKIPECSRYRYYRIPVWVWLILGYTLFLLSSLQWIGIYCDTPDMCVAAIVYLAAALLLRIYRCSRTWLNFSVLGAVLGFGYLAKTAMFPLAFVFLMTGMFSVGNLRKALLPTLASLLIFITISSPLIVAISTAKGTLTFGDTGKLNYAWIVANEVKPYRFWQGKETGSGKPKHAPREIFNNPEIFEFATPVSGTYPPWYDPSYWYEGLIVKFNFERQISVFEKNVSYYCNIFFGVLVFAYLIIAIAGGSFWLSVKGLIGNWVLLIPALAGLVIYMIGIDMPKAFIEKQPSTRYIAPFIVLLLAGVFSSVRLPNVKGTKRLTASIILAILVLINIQQVFYQTSEELWIILTEPKQHLQWQVANTLNELGIQPGEKVAILGRYIYPHYHWARLAGVKIVAEVLDGYGFWTKDSVVRAKILKDIERTGSSVIVQKPGINIPHSVSTDGWQKIGNTNYYAYFFQK